jgi:hypothetical protein
MTTNTTTEFDRVYWANQALLSQNACNARGVLRSAVRCADAWGEATGGSDQNDNVALRFLLHQVAFLSGGVGLELYGSLLAYARDRDILEQWIAGPTV